MYFVIIMNGKGVISSCWGVTCPESLGVGGTHTKCLRIGFCSWGSKRIVVGRHLCPLKFTAGPVMLHSSKRYFKVTRLRIILEKQEWHLGAWKTCGPFHTYHPWLFRGPDPLSSVAEEGLKITVVSPDYLRGGDDDVGASVMFQQLSVAKLTVYGRHNHHAKEQYHQNMRHCVWMYVGLCVGLCAILGSMCLQKIVNHKK